MGWVSMGNTALLGRESQTPPNSAPPAWRTVWNSGWGGESRGRGCMLSGGPKDCQLCPSQPVAPLEMGVPAHYWVGDSTLVL